LYSPEILEMELFVKYNNTDICVTISKIYDTVLFLTYLCYMLESNHRIQLHFQSSEGQIDNKKSSPIRNLHNISYSCRVESSDPMSSSIGVVIPSLDEGWDLSCECGVLKDTQRSEFDLGIRRTTS